jgi:hypothetical protein
MQFIFIIVNLQNYSLSVENYWLQAFVFLSSGEPKTATQVYFG